MSRHIDIALYRPTISCGFAPGHPGDFANDGEKHTFWLAPAHIDQPWWQVDLEGKYNIKDLSITTPRPGPYRCKVEFSVGGRHWTGRRILKIAAGTHEATLTFTPHQMTRYVRIVLIHAPVDGRGLSEVNIHGEVVG